jgi:glycosyltransferase involved in cell wall biosynthesis
MAAVPLVSIVLPVRNAHATLPRAVASLRGQTLRDWELVAVDDGSTDGSRELLHVAAQADGRIRLVEQPALGLVAALNAGLAAARGRFIARMDADDECHPERLGEQRSWLEAHAEFGLVSCQVGYGGDRVANAGYALHVDWINSLVRPEDIALNRFVEAPFVHPSVMFRRELIEQHGGYREGDFPEDYELWLRWLDSGVRMGKVPRELLVWHDTVGRLSRTDPRYSPEAFFRIKAQYLARHLARAGRSAVWIWGAGRPTRKRAAFLSEYGIRIAGYIDVDAKKTGRSVGGVPVIGPERLPAAGSVLVLGYVSSRGARELIRAALVQRGYREGSDFLMCA